MSSTLLARAVFLDAVYNYCLTFSGSVTSWCRSVQHNRAVGGVAKSAHLKGLAVDVVYDGSSPGDEADEWLRKVGLKRIPEDDHDHLMPLDWKG